MAGTVLLQASPTDLNCRSLDIALVSPASSYRVSRYHSGEPHFGQSGSCRLDEAQPDTSKRFGTCYLGFDLTVAFAESVLHDLQPDAGGFQVPLTEVTSRFALSFKASKRGATRRLAKLYSTALLRLGGNDELSGTPDSTLLQAWATALVAHPDQIDGVLYMSRGIKDALAVVLFERGPAASPPIQMDKFVPLVHHRDYLPAIEALCVRLN